MNVIFFTTTAFSLLFAMALTLLLLWANYKANFIYKDGKTVINWNSAGEGKPEFFIFLVAFILATVSFLAFILT